MSVRCKNLGRVLMQAELGHSCSSLLAGFDSDSRHSQSVTYWTRRVCLGGRSQDPGRVLIQS